MFAIAGIFTLRSCGAVYGNLSCLFMCVGGYVCGSVTQ